MEPEQEKSCGQGQGLEKESERLDALKWGELEEVGSFYDSGLFDRLAYGEYERATPGVIRLMILKSEWMMTKYLYERNSKWIGEEQRQEYVGGG
jgi:hypothetical protein